VLEIKLSHDPDLALGSREADDCAYLMILQGSRNRLHFEIRIIAIQFSAEQLRLSATMR
jgi:hypothetical protein